jgi:hypothetical protein
MGPIITVLHHIQAVLHACFCISSDNFDWFSNGLGILENSQNQEPNRGQNWRTGTGLNRTFSSVLSVLVLCISSGLNFGNTTHTGLDSDRYKAAMQVRNHRMRLYSQPELRHYCNRCTRFTTDGQLPFTYLFE